MRISPIFARKSAVTSSMRGVQAFEKMNCKKPQSSCANYDKGDIFIRLADASMRDKSIERELKSMGLI